MADSKEVKKSFIKTNLKNLGVSPIKPLFNTAVLYGITTPVMILVVLHIANNKTIMKNFVNNRRSNIMGWITFIIMTTAALFLLYTSYT